MAGTNLAKAYVQIVPSAQGIKGSLTNMLSNEAGTAGDHAGSTIGANLVSKLKAVIVTAGIGKILQSSLLEGANVQQSLGGIETLFKDSADKVIANAKNAYKTAGMSANEYMETVTSFSASLLQGLAGDTNKAADVAHTALTDMSDNANKMGTSMELIQNAYNGFAKQNYTMLDNLKLGYGGTKTEMERLLKDAQKISGVKYDINNLADVYNAIHVIQEEMGITGTTAKEAASTFSGSLASMKAAASNVLADLALGEEMDDSLFELRETIFTFVQGNLMPMIGNILLSLPSVIGQAMTLIVQSLNVIGNNSEAILKTGINLVKGIANAILTSIPYVAESAFYLVTEFAKTVINTDWFAVANDFISNLKEGLDVAAGEIFGADEDIIGAFVQMIKSNLPMVLESGSEMLRNLVQGITSNLPNLILSAVHTVSELRNTILSNAPLLVETGLDLIGKLAEGIMSQLPVLLETGEMLLSELITNIEQQLPMILQTGMSLLLNFVNGISEAIPNIGNVVIEVMDTLLSVIFDNAPAVWESGKLLLQELIGGLKESVPNLLNAIAGFMRDFLTEMYKHLPELLESGKTLLGSIVSGITSKLGDVVDSAIKIVSYLLDKILDNAPDLIKAGFNLVLQLITGLINNLPNILSAAVRLVGGLRQTIVEYAPKLIETGLTLVGELVAGIIKAIPNVVAQIPKIIKGIKNEFTSIDWKSVGKNILSGIAKGIVNGGSAIIDAAKEAASSALKAAKKALGIKSPSTIFENEVGKMIDMGLAEGIENNVGAVSDSMKELSRATVGMIDTDVSMPSGNIYHEDATQDNMFEVLLQVIALLEKYLPELANMQVVMEDGAVAGKLVPRLNLLMHEISDETDRGM